MDVAGVIDEVGPGAAWQVGAPVIAVVVATESHGGAYADELVVAADSVTGMRN